MSIPPVICDAPNCDEHGCIFCRIIERKEPARIVAETDRAIAIFPLGMSVFGHTLVLPKNHVPGLFDARWEDLSDAMWLVKDVAQRLKDTLNCEGMNLIQSTGECATQSVNHVHFHVVPRNTDDRWAQQKGWFWPRSLKPRGVELDELLVKLHQTLTQKETSAD